MKISQQQSNRWKRLIVLVIPIFLIGAVKVLSIWKEIPVGNLTWDIVATANVPVYTGFFSQIGIFFWVATATLCIFSASLSSQHQEILGFKRFLYVSGFLTIFLGVDDIFLLHEAVFPFFGIPEKVVYASYGFILISWIVKFYTTILRTDYILLLMAFFFLGLSVGLDVFPLSNIDLYLFEDGFKMTGIVSWFFYFYGNSVKAVSKT